MCRQYIATHYGDEEARCALVYEDEGFSGGNLDRPRFKKMMKDSHKIQFYAIVVYRLDRISRNIGDFAKLIEELSDRGIGFISIREQFDTSSPMGRAMMYIASVFSQLERETISERIRDNMHELAKTGRWLGGMTPTGYESESISNVTIDGKTRKACKLKSVPQEIGLVKLIFDKFCETGSLKTTGQFLHAEGYSTKRGKRFTRFALKGILSNPVYMIADEDAFDYFTEKEVDLFSEKDEFDGEHGIMAYNRTLQRKGKTTQEKPMNEWIVSVGRHKGIISGRNWIRVQEMLEKNRAKAYRKPRGNTAILSGILVCGKCGAHMRPKMSERFNGNGDKVYTYICTAKEKSRGEMCDMKNINGNTIDSVVIKEVKQLGKCNSYTAKRILRMKKQITVESEGDNSRSASLKFQFEENDKKIKSLVSSLERIGGEHAEKYIIKEIDQLHEKNELLKKRIAEEESDTGLNYDDTETDKIADSICTLEKCVDYFSTEQKREFVKAITEKIVWDGENIHIYLLGSVEEENCEEGKSLIPLGEDSK